MQYNPDLIWRKKKFLFFVDCGVVFIRPLFFERKWKWRKRRLRRGEQYLNVNWICMFDWWPVRESGVVCWPYRAKNLSSGLALCRLRHRRHKSPVAAGRHRPRPPAGRCPGTCAHLSVLSWKKVFWLWPANSLGGNLHNWLFFEFFIFLLKKSGNSKVLNEVHMFLVLLRTAHLSVMQSSLNGLFWPFLAGSLEKWWAQGSQRSKMFLCAAGCLNFISVGPRKSRPLALPGTKRKEIVLLWLLSMKNLFIANHPAGG